MLLHQTLKDWPKQYFDLGTSFEESSLDHRLLLLGDVLHLHLDLVFLARWRTHDERRQFGVPHLRVRGNRIADQC